MKTLVISYSLTGNNGALAESTADEFQAEHVKITELGTRNTGRIVRDAIFNKTPKVQPAPERLKGYDLILLFGPVWMGQVASPLRPYLTYLKANPCKYAFISISGGALGPNPKLADDLKKRAGSEPILIIDQHIADLLPPEPKPTLKIASAYRINSEEIKKLSEKIFKIVREKV